MNDLNALPEPPAQPALAAAGLLGVRYQPPVNSLRKAEELKEKLAKLYGDMAWEAYLAKDESAHRLLTASVNLFEMACKISWLANDT